jgi:hypothetical protein
MREFVDAQIIEWQLLVRFHMDPVQYQNIFFWRVEVVNAHRFLAEARMNLAPTAHENGPGIRDRKPGPVSGLYLKKSGGRSNRPAYSGFVFGW